MAVEVDGQHQSDPAQAENDEIRTRWLEKQGINVLCISAESVRTNLDGVLTWVRMNAEERVRG